MITYELHKIINQYLLSALNCSSKGNCVCTKDVVTKRCYRLRDIFNSQYNKNVEMLVIGINYRWNNDRRSKKKNRLFHDKKAFYANEHLKIQTRRSFLLFYFNFFLFSSSVIIKKNISKDPCVCRVNR